MVQVEVIKISYYSPSKGYAIQLREVGGSRQLPIIVGSAEAQAIALAFEGIEMPRPLTHDLTIHVVRHLAATVEKVLITHIKNGTFYARVVIESEHMGFVKVDSRPSDAIAIGLRAAAPIYVTEAILNSADVDLQKGEPAVVTKELESDGEIHIEETIQNLNTILKTAIDEENYEVAAKIRDRITYLERD